MEYWLEELRGNLGMVGMWLYFKWSLFSCKGWGEIFWMVLIYRENVKVSFENKEMDILKEYFFREL